MADDKTEEPTAKKLKDARKKGQIARSRDLAVAAASVAAVIALGRAGGHIVEGLAEELTRSLSHFGDHPLDSISASDLDGLVIKGLFTLTLLVAPIGLATMFAGVG